MFDVYFLPDLAECFLFVCSRVLFSAFVSVLFLKPKCKIKHGKLEHNESGFRLLEAHPSWLLGFSCAFNAVMS